MANTDYPGRRRVICFLVVCLGATTVGWAQQPKLLRWKLRPGERMKVDIIQDMKMATLMMGKEVVTSADMGMTMGWNVDSVSPEGVAVVNQSIERMRIKSENPGAEPVVYDSAAPGQSEGMVKALADNIQPLIGVKFTQQMNDRGEILAVQLSDNARSRLASAPQLQEVFSKEGMKSLMNQAATVLPAQPIRPGQSWRGKTESNSPVGTLMMDMTYVYRGTVQRGNQQLEKIDVDIHVGFGDKPAANGLIVSVAQQSNQGSMYFDSVHGRFVDSELRQNMTLVTSLGDKKHEQKLNTLLRMRFSPVPNREPAMQQVGHRPATGSVRHAGR